MCMYGFTCTSSGLLCLRQVDQIALRHTHIHTNHSVKESLPCCLSHPLAPPVRLFWWVVSCLMANNPSYKSHCFSSVVSNQHSVKYYDKLQLLMLNVVSVSAV